MKDMLQAKIVDAEFFVKRETIENIGIKRIIHDYPNSSIRYIEDQGGFPFSATIEIFFKDKNSFELFASVMKKSEAGRLILPVYGIVDNVKAMPSNVDIDYTSLGKYSMVVNFSETSEKPSPMTSETTSTDIASAGEEARQETKKEFSKTYSVPSSVLNATAIVSDAVVLSQVLFNVIKDRILLLKFSKNFQKKIQNADLLAKYLLNSDDPVGFLEDISLKINNFNAYKKIAIIGNNLPSEMYDILDGQVMTYDVPVSSRDLNFTIPTWGVETKDREERTKNRCLLINTFRIIGLIGMMESAIKKEYTTAIEIIKVMQDIEYYFENIIDKDITDILISNLKNFLYNLKGKTFEVLMQKKQNAYKTVTININNPIPSTLLAYNLYGEYIKTEIDLMNYANILEGLNNQVPAHLMNGDLQVIQIE
jgi:hypothetical protein